MTPKREPARLEPVKDQVVLVDQVGYLPAYPKLGFVSDANATTFQVVDVQQQSERAVREPGRRGARS